MPTGLATRCPACATVFRVVPDQLRVSGGWVRCGRCSDVFNASEALIDLDTGTPPRPVATDGVQHAPWPPTAAAVSTVRPADGAPRLVAAAPSQHDGPHDTRGPYDSRDPQDTDESRQQSRREVPPATASFIDSAESRFSDAQDDRPASADAVESGFDHTTALEPGFTHPLDDAPPDADVEPPFVPDSPDSPDSPDLPDVPDATDAPDAPDAPDGPHVPQGPPARHASDGLHADPHDRPGHAAMPLADALAGARQTPSFMRRAERAQRWRQPRVRAALAGAALLAALGLAAQVAHAYRDLLAAHLPATRTALAQACSWLGCIVGPAHAIDNFSVDSSGLLRVEKSSIYKLSVALRNRAAIDLALPAVELALTDSQGRLLARRVLLPAELGSVQTTLAAGRDLALQATLQTTFNGAAPEPVAVAGYTVDIFYP